MSVQIQINMDFQIPDCVCRHGMPPYVETAMLTFTVHLFAGRISRGALTLERGLGMCRGHDPLFSGQSPLPSLPIYCQCAALVTPVYNF